MERLTRRQASARILAVTAAGGSALGMGLRSAAAQPATQVKSILDGLIEEGRERYWTFTAIVNVQSYERSDSNGMPVISDFRIKDGAVLFPVLKGTGSSETNLPEVQTKLTFNDRLVDDSATYIEDRQSGSRYARLDLKDVIGREVELRVDTPMRTFETRFNEKKAVAIPWPTTEWGPIAKSCFDAQLGVDYDHPIIQQTVKNWAEGKDPKSIPPVTLAKYFLGKMIEAVQPSGNGESHARNTGLEGINLKLASETIRDGRGSFHDASVALCAVYRAAGLPARVVIGWDVTEQKGEERTGLSSSSSADLRSWVEFCLYDPAAQKELWVPVDFQEFRKRSSKMPDFGRTWKYFGTHDKLDDIMPFAFHFHPPIQGVVAHGSPSFWGWFTLPQAQVADQFVRFQSKTTPSRANDPFRKKR